jgi:hypothetical protein
MDSEANFLLINPSLIDYLASDNLVLSKSFELNAERPVAKHIALKLPVTRQLNYGTRFNFHDGTVPKCF